MRTLTFLIIVFVSSLSGYAQTANYTVSSPNDVQMIHDGTVMYNLYDTLSGANDTLVVSLPSHFQYSQASLCATWLATGTTSSSFALLQGRNATHETWQTISTATYAAEITTACDNDPVPYAYIRLQMVSAANIAHLRTTLVLKRL